MASVDSCSCAHLHADGDADSPNIFLEGQLLPYVFYSTLNTTYGPKFFPNLWDDVTFSTDRDKTTRKVEEVFLLSACALLWKKYRSAGKTLELLKQYLLRNKDTMYPLVYDSVLHKLDHSVFDEQVSEVVLNWCKSLYTSSAPRRLSAKRFEPTCQVKLHRSLRSLLKGAKGGQSSLKVLLYDEIFRFEGDQRLFPHQLSSKLWQNLLRLSRQAANTPVVRLEQEEESSIASQPIPIAMLHAALIDNARGKPRLNPAIRFLKSSVPAGGTHPDLQSLRKLSAHDSCESVQAPLPARGKPPLSPKIHFLKSKFPACVAGKPDLQSLLKLPVEDSCQSPKSRFQASLIQVVKLSTVSQTVHAVDGQKMPIPPSCFSQPLCQPTDSTWNRTKLLQIFRLCLPIDGNDVRFHYPWLSKTYSGTVTKEKLGVTRELLSLLSKCYWMYDHFLRSPETVDRHWHQYSVRVTYYLDRNGRDRKRQNLADLRLFMTSNAVCVDDDDVCDFLRRWTRWVKLKQYPLSSRMKLFDRQTVYETLQALKRVPKEVTLGNLFDEISFGWKTNQILIDSTLVFVEVLLSCMEKQRVLFVDMSDAYTEQTPHSGQSCFLPVRSLLPSAVDSPKLSHPPQDEVQLLICSAKPASSKQPTTKSIKPTTSCLVAPSSLSTTASSSKTTVNKLTTSAKTNCSTVIDVTDDEPKHPSKKCVTTACVTPISLGGKPTATTQPAQSKPSTTQPSQTSSGKPTATTQPAQSKPSTTQPSQTSLGKPTATTQPAQSKPSTTHPSQTSSGKPTATTQPSQSKPSTTQPSQTSSGKPPSTSTKHPVQQVIPIVPVSKTETSSQPPMWKHSWLLKTALYYILNAKSSSYPDLWDLRNDHDLEFHVFLSVAAYGYAKYLRDHATALSFWEKDTKSFTATAIDLVRSSARAKQHSAETEPCLQRWAEEVRPTRIKSFDKWPTQLQTLCEVRSNSTGYTPGWKEILLFHSDKRLFSGESNFRMQEAWDNLVSFLDETKEFDKLADMLPSESWTEQSWRCSSITRVTLSMAVSVVKDPYNRGPHRERLLPLMRYTPTEIYQQPVSEQTLFHLLDLLSILYHCYDGHLRTRKITKASWWSYVREYPYNTLCFDYRHLLLMKPYYKHWTKSYQRYIKFWYKSHVAAIPPKTKLFDKTCIQQLCDIVKWIPSLRIQKLGGCPSPGADLEGCASFIHYCRISNWIKFRSEEFWDRIIQLLESQKVPFDSLPDVQLGSPALHRLLEEIKSAQVLSTFHKSLVQSCKIVVKEHQPASSAPCTDHSKSCHLSQPAILGLKLVVLTRTRIIKHRLASQSPNNNTDVEEEHTDKRCKVESQFADVPREKRSMSHWFRLIYNDETSNKEEDHHSGHQLSWDTLSAEDRKVLSVFRKEAASLVSPLTSKRPEIKHLYSLFYYLSCKHGCSKQSLRCMQEFGEKVLGMLCLCFRRQSWLLNLRNKQNHAEAIRALDKSQHEDNKAYLPYKKALAVIDRLLDFPLSETVMCAKRKREFFDE